MQNNPSEKSINISDLDQVVNKVEIILSDSNLKKKDSNYSTNLEV